MVESLANTAINEEGVLRLNNAHDPDEVKRFVKCYHLNFLPHI